MKILVLAVLAFVCLGAESSLGVDNMNNCVTVKQKCQLHLKQTKLGFELGGIDFRSGPVTKVGQIKLNSDLIQKMTEIAQILDQMQMSRCQLLSSVTTCDTVRERILIVQAISIEQLGQLAILAQIYSGNVDKLSEALLKWIMQSSAVIQKVYEKQFMGAGGATTKDLTTTKAALEYASTQLKLPSDSPEFFRTIKENQIRAQLDK